MEVQHGIWKIATGKGDRHYIRCMDTGANGGLMHPEQIAEMNGLGSYGWENIRDLAIAIELFEKAVNESNSISGAVNELHKFKNTQDKTDVIAFNDNLDD